MTKDNQQATFSGDGETVKTKKKETSIWTSFGKIAAGIITVAPVIYKIAKKIR